MKRSEIKSRPLRDTVFSSLEPESVVYRVHDGEKLYFRVKPDGNKSWEFRYTKPDGKTSWLGLGGYPAISVSQARKKAAVIRNDIAEGIDPLAAKRARKKSLTKTTNCTFEDLAREWHATKAKSWSEGTAIRIMGALALHVFPRFGKRSYVEITAMEWMEFLHALEKKGIIEQTKRIRAMCRDVYDLARVTARTQCNPLEGLHKYLTTKPAESFAHVSPSELPALLRAIRSYATYDVSIGLQLLSMLACRPSELREARWCEIDLESGLWTIPAERMKRRREHLIPLPRQAVELLHQLHQFTGYGQFLFPSRGNMTKPRSDTVFLMALRRLGYEGRQTGHGFRHIASTLLNERGFDGNHIEAQLSHVKEGVAGVYNKAQYLTQRREMMQWYANHLDALAAGNVVEMKRA